VAESGGVVCNQCGPFADGFAVVKWFKDVNFPEALQLVADAAGILPANPERPKNTPGKKGGGGKKSPDAGFLRFLREKGRERLPELAKELGVSAEALAKIGAGWWPSPKCWTFPERRGAEVCGISQRFADGKKPLLPGGKRGLYFADDWKQPDGPVLIVEGASDTAAAVGLGLRAIGRPGAKVPGEVLPFLVEMLRELPETEVIVVAENDRKMDGKCPGLEGAQDTARKLAAELGRPVRWALPPQDVKDLRQWVQRNPEKCGADFLATLKQPEQEQPGAEVFPEFEVCSVDEKAATDFAVEALAKCEDIFASDTGLIQLYRSEVGAYAVHRLAKESLRELISARMRFFRMDAEGLVKSFKPVPKYVPENILARAEWRGVRKLKRIVNSPFIRPDGSLCYSSGYDAASATFADFEPAEWPKIPEQPTREDALAALAVLEDLVSEFCWDSETSRAAWLGLLLTLAIRPAIDGDCPAWLVDATAPGSGKSLSVDVATGIVCGAFLPKRSFPSDPAEQEKRLFSALLELPQPALICWDNLSGRVGGDAIESYLTAGGVWSSRVLGLSQTRSVSNKAIMTFTANGICATDDMTRRSLLIRLKPHVENPEQQRFKLPDIRAHVLNNRRELLAAALTLWTAYQAAGRPKAERELASWGGFQRFSDCVRECLVWLGVTDPFGSRAALQEQVAAKANALKDLKAAMADNEWTAQELIDQAKEDEGLREALESFCDCSLKDLTGQKLGKRLAKVKGKIVGGCELTLKEGRSRAKYWSFKPVGSLVNGECGAIGGIVSATREFEFDLSEVYT
jgi:putative DNA primase/helicase